ncbi:MAG: type II toxin-antitoxin system RelE/ParE family toxin [Pirellulales bacterium]|nr:type II toxin-antitoxin system RelE/ParE family toxin [Pirellulales bacterium]
MNRYRVELSNNAKQDLRDSYLWLANHDPEVAARWLLGFEQALESLDLNPSRCSVAPESETAGVEIRQYLYGKRRYVYRALFLVDDVNAVVRVLHIRHSSRQFAEPDELFGSE